MTRWLVVRREISERVRARAFRIGLAVQVGLIAVVLLIVALTNDGGNTREVGLVGPASQAYAAPLRASGPSLDARVEIRTLSDRAAAVAAVREGDLDAAVIDGREILVKHDPDDTLVAVVQATRRQLALREALTRAGVGGDRLAQALDPPALGVRATSRQPADHDARQGLAVVAVILLYIAIISNGMAIATGVVEEKASRVMEVVLSAISPRELLFGKIVGIGALGIGQFALTIVVGLLGASAVDAVELPSVAFGAGLLVVAWFVVGFLLYACLYAIAGALVSRSEDLQSSMGVLTMITISSYFIAFIGVSSPDSALTTAASLFPLSAPMAMPVRWLAGSVPAWQLALSFAIALVTAAALMRVAAAIYATTALRRGPKVALRAALAARRA